MGHFDRLMLRCTVTVSIIGGNVGAGGGPLVSLNATTGRLFTAFPFDFETANLYNLTLEIRDASSALGGPAVVYSYYNLSLVWPPQGGMLPVIVDAVTLCAIGCDSRPCWTPMTHPCCFPRRHFRIPKTRCSTTRRLAQSCTTSACSIKTLGIPVRVVRGNWNRYHRSTVTSEFGWSEFVSA